MADGGRISTSKFCQYGRRFGLCGRYQLDPGASAEIESIVRQVEAGIKLGEIFPTNAVPVLMEAGAELVPETAGWGFPRFGSKSGSVINARSETVLERRMFRKSMLERRCVVPTTGFYEWGIVADGKKQKYLFRLPHTPALYLAGLWNDFGGERRCVILTTAANASMDDIHDRMPVVLSREEAAAWAMDTRAAQDLLHRTPPELVHGEA